MTRQRLGLEVTVLSYGRTYRLTINQQTLEEKEAAAKLMNLPRDVTASILSRLGAAELLTRVQYVCRAWRDICCDPLMWRHVRFDDIYTAYPYDYLEDLYDLPMHVDRNYVKQWRPSRGHRLLDRLCLFAVDRSLGSMESITIRYFATDESLLYVAERYTKEALISVAAQVPFLEKLEFSYSYVRASVLEAFARCCPFLVSLEVVMRRNTNLFLNNPSSHLSKVVRVIVQRMPNLVHLQLGGFMKDDDLRAILDGCPRLESLDLYNCRGIDLDGKLSVRCATQIKELRLPYDPTDDDSDWYDRSSPNYDSDRSFNEPFGNSDSEDDYDKYYQEYDDYDDIYLI